MFHVREVVREGAELAQKGEDGGHVDVIDPKRVLEPEPHRRPRLSAGSEFSECFDPQLRPGTRSKPETQVLSLPSQLDAVPIRIPPSQDPPEKGERPRKQGAQTTLL